LPFRAPPIPRNLIARDRLQSGLAAAVVVAQTGVQGGTMHTARFAAEQGRPLFCPVPHGENGKSEGLRVLLERPGRELCERIPAWKQARGLCLRLGAQPVARPVERDRLDLLLDSLELALVRPAERDQQALLFPANVEA
jgi:DNA processing protein